MRRHTAKVDYDIARTVPASVLAELQSALTDPGVHFGGTIDAARVGPLRQLCLDSARGEMSTQRTALESLKLMRIGPAEIARHRDGISMNGLVPRMASTPGAFDRSQAPAEGSLGFKQALARFDGHSRSAMGFVWLSTASAEHSRRARSAAPKCAPAAPTCGCSSRPPSSACKRIR